MKRLKNFAFGIPRSALNTDNSVLNGKNYQPHQVFGTGFFEQAGTVAFYCSDTEKYLIGNLLVGVFLANELEYFDLAVVQLNVLLRRIVVARSYQLLNKCDRKVFVE